MSFSSELTTESAQEDGRYPYLLAVGVQDDIFVPAVAGHGHLLGFAGPLAVRLIAHHGRRP